MSKAISKDIRLFRQLIFLLGMITSASMPIAAEEPQGSRVIMGGGEQTDEIIDRFVELAGGAEARLVVIPTASSDETPPETTASEVTKRWRARGIENTVLLHTRDQDEANRNDFSAPLRETTEVRLSGLIQAPACSGPALITDRVR